ncbi:MAG: Hint domain-containing protein [Pseudomonadota bacterium]
MAIGEAGTLQENTDFTNEPIRVELTEPLTDPVIVMIGENDGGNRYVLRVLTDLEETNADGDTTAFFFTMQEFENHDGPHPRIETINWFAVEQGVHTLPDGRTIEVGEFLATEAPQTVPLTGDYGTDTPIILTNVNDAIKPGGDVVDPDPTNASGSGFTLELNQEEGQTDAITPEVVGYIAVQPGTGIDSGGAQIQTDLDSGTSIYGLVGAPYTNPIVVAETQTINDPDPGSVFLRDTNAVDDNTEVGLRFEEDSAGGAETTHGNETVGIVTFEEGLILCFTAGTLIKTTRGPVAVENLQIGDLIVTKDHGAQPLRWIGGKTIGATQLAEQPKLQPITIRKDAFGPGCPSRELSMSQQHRLVITSPEAEMLFGTPEVFVIAKSLASAQPKQARSVRYYHLMFDQHQVVYANGLEAESLHPGHLAADGLDAKSREELFAIFPELRAIPQSYGPACRPILKAHEARYIAAPRVVH